MVNDLHYCYPFKSWQCWSGKHWQEDLTGEIVRRVKDTQAMLFRWAAAEIKKLGKIGDDQEKAAKFKQLTTLMNHVLKWENAKLIAASIDLARSEPGIPLLPRQLDTDPFLFNVLNGTVDLRSGRLREHRREDLISKLAPVEYNPDAKCPMWERCVYRWMDGRAGLIRYLQRTAGYALTADVREQCLFFFHGSGSNGKTTYLGTLLKMMGDYGMQAVSELLMAKHNEAHPTERADLFGRRFVCTIETEDGKRMAEALMKQMTGGDRMRARKMHKDFFEFSPTAKILLAANHRPTIRGTDLAVWRRIKLVPFTVTITDAEKDKTLPDKLQAELPGILAWAVAGCMDWLRDGLAEPDEVRAATEEYRGEQDRVGVFLVGRCVVGSGYRVKVSDLYTAYQEWARKGGEHELAGQAFGRTMMEKGFERDAGRRWYLGVMLRADD